MASPLFHYLNRLRGEGEEWGVSDILGVCGKEGEGLVKRDGRRE